MAKIKDIRNQRFGRLVALYPTGEANNNGAFIWHCICDCGNYIDVAGVYLRNGNTKSCGCGQVYYHQIHGMSNTPEFAAWRAMIDRCYNKKNKHYKNYGGRGIKVCDRWLESFESFFEDMGPRPSSKHSIDRIDVNGNYCPENCRWATIKEQTINKRTNRFLYDDQGNKFTHSQIAYQFEVGRYVVARLVKKNLSYNEIISKLETRYGKKKEVKCLKR